MPLNKCVQLAAGSAIAAGLVVGALSAGAGLAGAQPPSCPPGQNCGNGPGGHGGPGGPDNHGGPGGPGGPDNHGGPGGPGGPDNHGGPGGPGNHGGGNGWHPAPPPPLAGGRHDRPAPPPGAPDWGWGPGQGYVPVWAHQRPVAPWWAPGAKVYWSQDRNAWGFWWGWPLGFWFPA